MLTIDSYLIIVRERHQQIRQEAERERLIRAAGFRQPVNMGRLWQVAGQSRPK